MIYSKNEADNNTNVLIAKEGRMYRTPDDKYLVLKLNDGIKYEEAPGDRNVEPRQRFTRFRFKETEQKFDLDFLHIHRTDESLFTSAVMMDLKQLGHFVDSTKKQTDSTRNINYKLISPYIKYFNIPKKPSAGIKYKIYKDDNPLSGLNTSQQVLALSNAANEVRSVQETVKNRADNYKEISKSMHNYALEYQKKFELSAACIVLFLIGAPLGAIIRKGGLGYARSGVGCFLPALLYHLDDRRKIRKKRRPFSRYRRMGFIDGVNPVGLFLSYKAANDSALFDMDAYRRFFTRLIRRKEA